eukprot:Nitzschia sp. Nitz4//scaffold2_size372955//41768//45868//NITZ4_000365-RA/size372955-processed-gene-0.8-mRNA-1//1//CDS//3329546602//8967//frame0
MGKRKSDEDSDTDVELEGEEPVDPSVDSDDDDNEENVDEDEEMEEEQPRTPKTSVVDSPFMDSFYGLSSENPQERAKAAHVMLEHCLLGSEANAKDASYGFRRLLNGVCSGRASARQGNASALAGFLKIAFHLGKMEEIRGESEDDASLLTYVRERLITVTDPNQISGKKKGSEERDYQFGRLFGILAVARSRILLIQDDSAGDVAVKLAADLSELFWAKRWMREPAAHGITTLLKLFLDSKSDEHKAISKRIVEEVVLPELLRKDSTGETGSSDHSALIGSFCAEQIGIVLFIQSYASSQSKKLPFPLNQPIATSQSMPGLAQALSETSVVVTPRTHFVWDALWSYLSEPQGQTASKGNMKNGVVRVLRPTIPHGNESAAEVLASIVKEVVMQKLLHIDSDKSGGGKATHERRALALNIVKHLAGVQHISTVLGPTQILVEAKIIETVLFTPEIVRSLFVDVICAGNEKKQTSHMLKPMAVETLNEISEVTLGDENKSCERQVAVAQAFVFSEPRFDARTKTSFVASLVSQTTQSAWDSYMGYLRSNFLLECAKETAGDGGARATGFVELLYGASKIVLRSESDKETPLEKDSCVRNILRLFMTTAFFDISTAKSPSTPKGKKSKGRKSKSNDSNPMSPSIHEVKEALDGQKIPHGIRALVSARYFSLLSEFCGARSHGILTEGKEVSEKDSSFLEVLVGQHQDWQSLEQTGAKRIDAPDGTSEEGNEVDPLEQLSQLLSLESSASKAAADNREDAELQAKKRCCTGVAVLGVSLFVHRLSCGQDGTENEDPDADDENDEDEICNALEGLKDAVNGFLEGPSDDMTNPLLALAELCANILSSPLGSGNMGRAASPKLIREAVKFAWLGGLRLSAALATEEQSFLDTSVVNTLLEAIGANNDLGDDSPGDEDSEMEDDEEDDEDDDEMDVDDENEDVFAAAAKVLDDDEMPSEESDKSDDQDSDVELDASNLQTLLEEDSDADVDENMLEHHEGADAALAKLIKLKQEARKAGKQARERIETAHQLRCTVLLELLFGRSDPWKNLFRAEVVLGVIIPILKHRKHVEKTLKQELESGGKSGIADTRALIEKLTAILRQKICKLRLNSLPYGSSVSAELAQDIASRILIEANGVDTSEQATCCNSCFIFVMRSLSDPSSAKSVASILSKAVVDWSTKRTTKVHSSLFDDVLSQAPALAQIAMLEPMCNATQNARTHFLKSEAFHFVGKLLAVKPTEDGTELETAASEALIAARVPFLTSLVVALKDDEMKKAKRIRPILKASEKFLAGIKPPAEASVISNLEAVAELLQTLGESEAQGVQATAKKLKEDIEGKLSELKAAAAAAEKEQKGSWQTPTSSKKKKKKGKKK